MRPKPPNGVSSKPSPNPLSQRQIRERAATRNKTVGAVLQRLVREGRIRHDAEECYSLAASQSENAAPAANGSGPDIARFPVLAVHAARRLIRKDTRILRVRLALDGQDWNDMLIRDRRGELLQTDDRHIN